MVYERKHCGCGLKKEVNINELGVGRCSKALDEFLNFFIPKFDWANF